MKKIAVIGGGPAGLMAAQTAISQGCAVELYDQMPSVGRKFLLAGKGGLNLTHSLTRPQFDHAYSASQKNVSEWLDQFDNNALREWARELGFETFVGSSGRVFPTDLKAAPLLRTWLRRLRELGVVFLMRHRWLGFDSQFNPKFDFDGREIVSNADATVLALGGASWPILGSDAAWVNILRAQEVSVSPLVPSNCGFEIDCSDYLLKNFAGTPIKPIVLMHQDRNGIEHRRQGEAVISHYGLEGSLIYAFSAKLRDAIARDGETTIFFDLCPHHSFQQLTDKLSRSRGSRSLTEHWKRSLQLNPWQIALLNEKRNSHDLDQSEISAQFLKRFPIRVLRTRPIEEAISTAGGVCLKQLDLRLMKNSLPGVFYAGEMLDWDAPTGGFLLTACFASGKIAGDGAVVWVNKNKIRNTAINENALMNKNHKP